MAKRFLLRPQGLSTAPNPLSEAAEGALETATNVFMRYPGVLETRPGFTSLGGSYSPVGAATASSIYVWLSPDGSTEYPIAHTRDNTIEYYVPSTWSAVSGTYADPVTDYSPVRFAEARKNLYFTTAAGPYRMTAYNATPIAAGVPKPISAKVQTEGTGSGAFVVTGYSVAYRATIVHEDANGGIKESAPSERLAYRNTSGNTVKPTVRVRLPTAQLTDTATTYTLRLYRSKVIANVTADPSDNMGLVYEVTLSSTDISTNKYYDIVDVVPDALIGAEGYFTPNQERILASNYTPPVAWDMCWHGRRMLYANTTSKHRLTVRLLSVDSASGGMAATDTFIVGGRTYTANTDFTIYTSGSAAVNVEQTARRLVEAINADASQTAVYASYISAADDPPGSILLEERGIGGNSFAATASDGGSAAAYWAPVLPTSGTSISSDNDRRKNRVYISKPDQPEAVPLANYVEVGNESDDILRIVELRDSVFVFKLRDGVYRITGVAQGAPSVQLVDPTVQFVAGKTVSQVANELYCLSSQGVVAVSDTGVRVVSGDIDDLLSGYLVETNSLTYSYGIGDERRRLYILALSSAAGGAVVPVFAYAYSTRHNAWFKWDKVGGYGAAIGPLENELYISGFNDDPNGVKAASDTCYKENTTYTDGATAISVTVKWVLNAGADPSGAKHWSRADFFFDADATLTSATATFSTDVNSTGVTSTLAPTAGQLYVAAPIGTAGQRGQLMSVQLDVAQDQKKTSLLGVVLHEPDSAERGRR